MGCETRKDFNNNLFKLIDGIKGEKFTDIKELDFLKDIAAPVRSMPFDIETLKKDFPNNRAATVIGDISIKYGKFFKHLESRTDDRTKLIGLIKPTLEDPLFVIKHHDKRRNRQEDRFYKPFVDPEDNLVHMMSISVNHKTNDILTTSYDSHLNKFNETIKYGDLLYPNKSDLSDGSTIRTPKEATTLQDTAITVSGILSNIKNKVNEIKNSDSKIDLTVDTIWDMIFQGLDKAAKPFKYTAEAMGVEGAKDSNWFEVSSTQRQASEVVNNYRNLQAHIYDEAATLMAGLDTLSKEDNVSLIKALNGDMAATQLKDTLKPFYEKFRSIIDTNADKLVEAGILSEKEKIEHYVKRYYKQYLEEGHNGRGGSVAYNKLKKRKDLSYDERIALGMVEDATFVISNTIAEQNILLQKAKVLQALADRFGSDEEIDGYIKISDASAKSGLKKYGALAGKWVHKDVKKELDYSRLVSEEFRMVEDGLYPLIDHLKVNLTVKNPVTHVYNIASNMLLAGLNGDMAALGKVMYMRAKSPKKFKELVAKANKYGLNSYLDDFEKAHIDLKPGSNDVNVVSSIWKTLYMTQDSKLGDGVRKLYDWEDKIFKLAAFNRLLEEGKDEAIAYKEAVEVYVDYSTPLPAFIRVVDKSGLMPFLHYQFKSTPAVAKVMAKHPLRTMIMGTGIFALGASAWQNDDEEYLTPDWANDKFNLFGVSEWVRLGNGYYLNAGRMIPGTKFEFELGGIIKGTLQIINGQTPLGYDINGKYDESLEKYGKRALVMAENYLPSMTLGRYMQRGVHIGLGAAGVVEPKKNYYDENMTVPELIGRAAGVRKFNEKKELKSKQKSASALKKHNDQAKNPDKKANQEQYNATARRIKQAAKAAGLDLTAGDDEFDVKVPKFDFGD